MDMLSRHLRRITTGGAWIPEIDGLRFVAILSVVLFHLLGELLSRSHQVIEVQPYYSLLVRMIGNGDRGVRLFFVISGYILGRPFFRQYRLAGPKISLAKYYLRRVTRLEPPYMLSLIFYSTALLIYFHTSLRVLLPHLLASLFYMHSLAYRQISTINYVTWSLEVEIQFYLLVPLMAKLFAIAHTAVRRMILVAIICACGWMQLHLATGSVLWLTIAAYLQYFLAGFLLADLLALPSLLLRRHLLWDLVSLLVWPTIFLLPHDWLPAHALLPLLIVLVYLAAFFGPASNGFFRIPWVAIVGGMCYSIYLMHPLVIDVCFKFTKHLVVFRDFLANYMTQAAFLGFLVLAVSTIFYVLVERPCMDPLWPQKLLARFHKVPELRAGAES